MDLDWYPTYDDAPQPDDFDSTHTAWIWFLDHDCEVRGILMRADRSTGAPEAWCVESATIDGVDVSELLWADEAAMRRAENALDLVRSEEWS